MNQSVISPPIVLRRRSSAEVAALVSIFEQGGQSMRDFCRQQQMLVSSFSSLHRRHAGKHSSATASPVAAHDAYSATAFLPVKIVECPHGGGYDEEFLTVCRNTRQHPHRHGAGLRWPHVAAACRRAWQGVWRADASWACSSASTWPTFCPASPTAPSNHWPSSPLWPMPQK